jgi:hypothetical protein
LPLAEKARIEVYLPDLPRPAYRRLLSALEQEFGYTFGGSTTIRGLQGKYRRDSGELEPDPINLIYTDVPLSLRDHHAELSRYTDDLRDAACEILDEQSVLIVVLSLLHSEPIQKGRARLPPSQAEVDSKNWALA